MTIKQLAAKLQKEIDLSIAEFNKGQQKIKALYEQIEEVEKEMAELVFDLEPVESIVIAQNPTLEKLFTTLKNVYKEHDDKTRATDKRV
jgi:t-SNARE complex subunit (syntaxin)